MLLSNTVLCVPSSPTEQSEVGDTDRSRGAHHPPGCPSPRVGAAFTGEVNLLPYGNSQYEEHPPGSRRRGVFRHIRTPRTDSSCSSLAVASAFINQLYMMYQSGNGAIKYTLIFGISNLLFAKKHFFYQLPSQLERFWRALRRAGQRGPRHAAGTLITSPHQKPFQTPATAARCFSAEESKIRTTRGKMGENRNFLCPYFF